MLFGNRYYGICTVWRQWMVNRQRRDALLRTADIQRSRGALAEAVEIYLVIVRDYPDTGAAQEAAAHLLDIAQEYEQQGHHELATDLHRKLESLMGQ